MAATTTPHPTAPHNDHPQTSPWPRLQCVPPSRTNTPRWRTSPFLSQIRDPGIRVIDAPRSATGNQDFTAACPPPTSAHKSRAAKPTATLPSRRTSPSVLNLRGLADDGLRSTTGRTTTTHPPGAVSGAAEGVVAGWQNISTISPQQLAREIAYGHGLRRISLGVVVGVALHSAPRL
ncbi:hypothetical protein BJ912DRAFT_1061250 [Pholiota molesta]|nr:hypothetical protein BJ912DRAFT_1061250 [Pholiota molesta]